MRVCRRSSRSSICGCGPSEVSGSGSARRGPLVRVARRDCSAGRLPFVVPGATAATGAGATNATALTGAPSTGSWGVVRIASRMRVRRVWAGRQLQQGELGRNLAEEGNLVGARLTGVQVGLELANLGSVQRVQDVGGASRSRRSPS